MTKPTAKQLKAQGLEYIAQGVRNRESFRTCIPFLTELRERIGLLQTCIRELQQIYKPLNEMVCDYADNNPAAFDAIRQVKDEADESLITIDGITYVYKRGWQGVKRISGNNLTGMFLDGLPEAWVRSTKELNVTELSRLDISDKELAKHDLQWCAKRTWSKEANE